MAEFLISQYYENKKIFNNQLKQMRFSTKNLVRRETGWYMTVVQMVWLIVQRRQDRFPSHAVTGRQDHPDIGPLVYDGLTHVLNAWAECYTQTNRNNEVRISLFTGYNLHLLETIF